MLRAGWPVSGMTAHVRERGAHHRQVAARDQDRALLEVEVERRFRLLVDDAEVQEQVRDRPVAMAGPALGFVDRLIDLEPAPGNRAEPVEQVRQRPGAVLRLQQRRHRDRTGVDHRVERPVAARLQLDRVEGVAARLDADALQHPLLPQLVDRHPERERLRDRLDRERPVAVAGGEHAAVARHQANAEIVWVGLAQFRNVGRDLAIGQRPVFGVDPVHQRLHFVRDVSFHSASTLDPVSGAISVPRCRPFSKDFIEASSVVATQMSQHALATTTMWHSWMRPSVFARALRVFHPAQKL